MIWLIGSGLMSTEYAKVLDAQKRDYIVIGRGRESATEFTEKTGKDVIEGGLKKFLASNPVVATKAIVSVGVAQLYETTLLLINAGVKNILVEKPGGMTIEEIQHLEDQSKAHSSNIFIAYNRRFFSSVIVANKLIEQDGGLTSFNFEFTEWGHIIEKLDKPKEVLRKWFLANSTHVADLAFYLGGTPTELSSFVKGSLKWHKAGAVFSGAGVSDKNAAFSYNANWNSAGRWSVELLTASNRYILCPMEELKVQQKGSVSIRNVNIDTEYDKNFKPGLYKQLEEFLSGDSYRLCTLSHQVKMFDIYNKMANY